MGIKEDKKKETVRRIREAATRAFAESGYEGARMDRIAESAGVNKAMLYYHVGDKDALYTWVLHGVFGDITARMEKNISESESPVGKIKAYIRSIGQTLEKHPNLLRIMMREMASSGSHFPELVAADMASIIGRIGDIIRQGHQQGVFRDVDPLVLHLMVMGGISYLKASSTIRSKHAELLHGVSDTKGVEDVFDMLNRVESIVLGALRAQHAEE
jgi:AcrR family transcriptional regulator